MVVPRVARVRTTRGFLSFRERQEWRFFACLRQADRPLATVWWALVLLRSVLPPLFAVTMGFVIGAVESDGSLTGPLAAMGECSCCSRWSRLSTRPWGRTSAIASPRGSTTTSPTPWSRRPASGTSRTPLIGDITVAREFNTGVSGPPMEVNLPFIATGLVDLGAGLASAIVLVGYSWWAPLVLAGAWGSTHWLLRDSAVWKDRNTPEVREASTHADYAFRIAVDPPAAKELRVFGLADWTLERFLHSRRQLFDLQQAATGCANGRWPNRCCWSAGPTRWSSCCSVGRDQGDVPLDRAVVYAQVAVGTS